MAAQDLAICVHGTTKVTPDQYLYTNAFMDKISGEQCCARGVKQPEHMLKCLFINWNQLNTDHVGLLPCRALP